MSDEGQQEHHWLRQINPIVHGFSSVRAMMAETSVL